MKPYRFEITSRDPGKMQHVSYWPIVKFLKGIVNECMLLEPSYSRQWHTYIGMLKKKQMNNNE